VRWTAGARADLMEMFAYVAAENPEAAARLRARIRADTARLVDHPGLGRVVPELGDSALRELIVRPYRVVCLALADEVHMLGVIHSRRLMPDFEHQG